MDRVRSRRSFVIVLVSLASAFASALAIATAAEARELSLYRAIFFDADGDENDHFFDYGTTSNTALSLSSGLDVVAVQHHIDFLDLANQVIGTADCSGIAGGTVGYGHLSGAVSGTTTSSGGGVWNYTDFRGGFVDTVVIHAPSPALIGTFGTFTASVLVEVEPNLTAIGTPGVPNDEAVATVGWILTADVGIGSAEFTDTDESDPTSIYSIINQQPASPAPHSVPVPVVVGFQYDVPFDLRLDFYAYGIGYARGWYDGISSFSEHSEGFLNTVAWQGISSVRDAFDQEVGGWTITSESGTDYANPVPEPTVGGLLAPGLLAIGGGVRRRSRGRIRRPSAGPRAGGVVRPEP